jgi:hypothetical protein
MLIIKDFTNWLTESADLVTEVTTPTAVKTLRADIVAGAPFNKWTVSKTYPTFMINPKWEVKGDGTGWLIKIKAYEFVANANSTNISAKPYREELITAIPTTDPSMANGGARGNQPPTTLPKGITVYSPAEATASQTFKMVAGNKSYASQNSFIPQATSLGEPWGLHFASGTEVLDAYATYEYIAGEDPSVTIDTYLGILNTAVKDASAIMAKQVKSGTVAGYPITKLKFNGFPLAQQLVDKVKTLVPAAPVVKPG